MRTLKFLANNGTDNQVQNSHEVQDYVANVLTQKLTKYGFETLAQSGAQVAVSVDQYALPLAVRCETQNADGHLVCEISSYPDEEQDWLARITERSLLNQLAQAVENSLKDEASLSEFKWIDQENI
ncbi:hypothetical protein B9T31_07610 [Acinetobacter sp. ANC 4558]|uniref:hypothetical protein n=1 Tax=Acinetobacter sp. ANC 4558 TaxID=1977876 RepID=UPI000A349D2C|nr:hypothetical protein [Acinetobacter sp. ANC 4558]OTG86358.1 hypothetical protein B9T31_07610 [Acinetobacter sp. ANC 4558]